MSSSPSLSDSAAPKHKLFTPHSIFSFQAYMPLLYLFGQLAYKPVLNSVVVVEKTNHDTGHYKERVVCPTRAKRQLPFVVFGCASVFRVNVYFTLTFSSFCSPVFSPSSLHLCPRRALLALPSQSSTLDVHQSMKSLLPSSSLPFII